MSFNWHAKRVRNADLPMPVRRQALSDSMQSFARTSGRRFREIEYWLDVHYHIRRNRLTHEQLLAAVEALTHERTMVLKKQHAFTAKRKEEKRQGKRHMSKEEQEEWRQIGRGALGD